MLAVKKTASESTVVPGETLSYTVEVSCSTLTALGCIDANFADAVPSEFEILSATVANASPNAAVIDGQNVTVAFDEDLGDGSIGLIDNAVATITITVKLREDLPHEADGVAISNTATVTAETAESKTSTAVVTPSIEAQLSTKAEKSFHPVAAQASPGTETTLTLAGTNSSNGGVDLLTLTDPVDPEAAGNPFTYLELVEAPEIVWPDGATTATLEYWNGTSWVGASLVTKPGTASAPPIDAGGVRVTFAAADGETIGQGAAGGLILTLEQRENVADLEETTVVANTVKSEVVLGDDSAENESTADYTIVTEPIEVAATKTFAPDLVLPGQSSNVTIGGSNAGLSPLEILTIREPSLGTFDERLSFTGFTSQVQFPQGAETGTLTLEYLDTLGNPATLVVDLTDGGSFPGLPGDFGSLQYFEISYTSTTESIIAGAESTIEFGVTTSEDLAKNETIDNEVVVTGTSGGVSAEQKADDTLTIDEKRLEIETQKMGV